MSKSANRAAGKAYAAEQRQKLIDENRAASIRQDLEHANNLRRYLVRRPGVAAQELVAAIDDFAEKLTGDRTALHLKNHSIP